MRLTFIAGEVSGDIHGAKLLNALKSKENNLEISGIGGDLMIAEGLDAIYHIRQMAFLGFSEVIRHLPLIRKVFRDILEHITSVRPDAVILIDYPGFNLRLAKKVKKLGIPVIYYISPQIWAWGRHRVQKIRAYVDQMLVIFPFEVAFYKKHGIDANYVGHPLVDSHYDHVKPKIYNDKNRVLGLLPGSRHQELEKLLHLMMASAAELFEHNIIDKVLIARVENISRQDYEIHTKNEKYFEIFEGSIDQFYNQIDVALVSSGTATLETAYFQVPLVIVYKVGNLTWYLAKRLVKLERIGLPNIVAGKMIATELLQTDFTSDKAGHELSDLLIKEHNEARRKDLKIVRERLGEPGASERAAEHILRLVNAE